MSVYDAICATVGAANVNSSTIGRTGRSAISGKGMVATCVMAKRKTPGRFRLGVDGSSGKRV